jgi:hypothetical protein
MPAPFVGRVCLDADPQSLGVLEVGLHGLELGVAVPDGKAVPFERDQGFDRRDGFHRIFGPVAAVLEPPRILMRVVVLFDWLVKDFQASFVGEPCDLIDFVKVVGHDHGFQADRKGSVSRTTNP